MAPKKPTSRLGSDPFGWIRDTRGQEEEELLQTPAEPEEPEKPAAPKAERPAKAKPAIKPVEPKAEEDEGAFAATPGEAVETGGDAAVEAAIEEAKAALTPQEIKALTMLLAEAKGPAKRGRPRTNFREVTKSSQEGLPENWTRATFIVRESHLETLKDYAYTQRMTIRDALDQALEQYLEDKQVIARRVRGE